MSTLLNQNPNEEKNLEKLLTLLSRYRIMNLQQIRQVFSTWQPDFSMLSKAGLIHFWPAPTPTGAMQHLLALARGGAVFLAGVRGCDAKDIPYLRPAELKKSLFTLEHTLLIAELGLTLEKLEEDEPEFKLLRLETSPTRIGASVRLIRDGEFWSVPLVADALAEVSFSGKKHSFLIEIDRGTTTLARMKRKFIGYEKWWKERGPLIRFGTKSMRLLVFTTTEQRLRLFRKSIQENIRSGAGFIWLTLLEKISIEEPEKLLSAIWCKAETGVKHYFLFTRTPGLGAPP